MESQWIRWHRVMDQVRLGPLRCSPRPASQEMPSIRSWTVSLQNPYPKFLTPSILGCNLIWRQGLYWGNQVRVAPNPACLITFQKRKIWTNRQHIARRWCQETQGEEGHVEPKREAWNRSLAHRPQKEPPSCQHLDLIGSIRYHGMEALGASNDVTDSPSQN